MPRAILADTITCDVLNANTINGSVSGGGGGSAEVDWNAVPEITVAGTTTTDSLVVMNATGHSIVALGGISVEKSSVITTGDATTLTVGSTLESTAYNAGALVVNGGIGVAKNSTITTGTATTLTVGSTKEAAITPGPAGALVVAGGASVAGKVYAGTLHTNSLQVASGSTLNIGTSPDITTLNIGNGDTATNIFIGGSNDTVVLSNAVNVTETNVQIEQNSIELGRIVPTPTTNQTTNAVDQGLRFAYYNGSTTPVATPGYFKVTGSNPGTSFAFKAPSTTGVATLTPGTSASDILTTVGGQTIAGGLSTTGVLASTGGITATKGTQEDSDAVKVTGEGQVYSAGSLQVNGGIGVAKTVFIADTTDSSKQSGTSYGTGALVVRGGAYVGKVLRLGGGLNDTNDAAGTSTTQKSGLMINETMDYVSPANGNNMNAALTCMGGAYVAKKLYVADTSTLTSITAVQTTPPSFTTAGSAWVKLNLCVGTTDNSAGSTQGNIYCTNDIAGFSDSRLKRDVVTIPNALEKVGRMRGVYFKRLAESSPVCVGLIAQEVQEVVPEAVREFDGYLSVTYGNLVGILIEAVKELKTQNEALVARVEALEAR